MVGHRLGEYRKSSYANAAKWRSTLAAVIVPGSLKQVSRKMVKLHAVATGPSTLRREDAALAQVHSGLKLHFGDTHRWYSDTNGPGMSGQAAVRNTT